MSEISIDGTGPYELVRPASLRELGDIIVQAGADGAALFPVGGGTKLDLGCPPNRPGRAVAMTGFDQVIDYPARDMTITVQAGITIDRLQEILAPENQRLPIDVARAEQATLGGILACNCSGPRRLGFGTLRDYLLGFSALNDQGQEFKAGGRVVKNVAGYDLGKLFIGSLGTLGIMTQATLKLRPLAGETALVTLETSAASLPGLIERMHETRTRPVCLELVNGGGGRALFEQAGLELPDLPWTLVIGLEGTSEAVHWQVQQLVREFGTGVPLEVRIGFTAQSLWSALTDFAAGPQAAVVFKANLLPSGVAEFCLAVDRDQVLLQAHTGNGIVLGLLRGDLPKDEALSMLNQWREQAARHLGRVVVRRCPPAWKSAPVVWGPAGADAQLMRRVKESFDPRRVFNPGRFVDGL